MKSLYRVCGLVALLALTGCQAVNTTSSGAVGVERKQYMLSMLTTEEINQSYALTYQETLDEAKQEGVLDSSSRQAKRLQRIGDDLIAQVSHFRADAAAWDWQVNLIDSPELNANCGPGGKIIFYSGIIEKLALTDDEIAAIMGHEIAHALREHGREQMSRAYGLEMAKSGVGALLGVGQTTMNVVDLAVNYGMMLPHSRGAEAEADLLGLELSARAGYDPNAAVTLWQKMERQGSGAPVEFLSTHPAASNRIQNLQQNIPKVMPLYQTASRRR